MVKINLSKPHLWYPMARNLAPRQIICHIGPTNSGKTFNALNSLMCAPTGIYCGPLRLLAWEITEKLRLNFIKCSLITGQERDLIENSTHTSCTIEMCNLNQFYDCAILDEMQMIGDESRGWAWTSALLGLQSSEIHVCGNSTFLPLLEAICQETNDQLIVKEYTRKSPLHIAKYSLNSSYQDIQKGDCIVAFNRRELYQIKNKIESMHHDLRCCIIYGGLPPNARKKQALLFNNPKTDESDDNRPYNVLVASDAIGMGLNLSIRRIIFSTLTKFDGNESRLLYSSEIKQIAGRAGRYGSQYEQGEVTVLHSNDHYYLKDGLIQSDTHLKKAYLFPTREQLELLGALIDTQVTKDELMEYWIDIFISLYGYEDYYNYMKDIPIGQFYSTTFILKYFQSITIFAKDLEIFLYNKQKNSKEYHHSIDPNTVPRENPIDISINSEGPRVPLHELFGMFKECAVQGTRGITPPPLPLPLPSTMYYSHVLNLEKNTLYRIGDLTEKQQQAACIAEYNIPFPDRYIFCLAPVSIENEKLRSILSIPIFLTPSSLLPSSSHHHLPLDAYRNIAHQFSKSQKVSLPSKYVSLLKSAKTPEDLLNLETSHQIFDLFLWLAMRFPERFENISEIEKKREECVELIDHALRNMRFPRKSINPTTRPQENRRRADQVIKKVRKLFPGEGWESINRR